MAHLSLAHGNESAAWIKFKQKHNLAVLNFEDDLSGNPEDRMLLRIVTGGSMKVTSTKLRSF